MWTIVRNTITKNAIKIVSNRYWPVRLCPYPSQAHGFLTDSQPINRSSFSLVLFPCTVMIVTWKIDYNRKISHGRLEQMNTKRDCNYDACSGQKKIAQEKWEKTEKTQLVRRQLGYESHTTEIIKSSSSRLNFLLLLQLFTGYVQRDVCVCVCMLSAHLRCSCMRTKANESANVE